MKTEQEQQQDYIERVRIVAPKVDAILKEAKLNLGAQFDAGVWPKNLKPVPIYVDVKNYAEEAEAPVPDAVTSPEPGIVSPIQPEDIGDNSN